MNTSGEDLFGEILGGICYSVKNDEPAAEIKDMIVESASFHSRMQEWRDSATNLNLLQTAVVLKRSRVIPLLSSFFFTFERVPGYPNVKVNPPLHLACKVGCLSSIISILGAHSLSAEEFDLGVDQRGGKGDGASTLSLTGYEISGCDETTPRRTFCDCTGCQTLANSGVNFCDIFNTMILSDECMNLLNECGLVTYPELSRLESMTTQSHLQSELRFPFQICVEEKHVECAIFLVELLFRHSCIQPYLPMLMFQETQFGNLFQEKDKTYDNLEPPDRLAHKNANRVSRLPEIQEFYVSHHILNKACCLGNSTFLKLILTYVKSLDVNTSGDGIINPLFMAVACGNYDCTVMLLENNANIRAVHDGLNVLDALYLSKKDISYFVTFTELLIENGVIVSSRNVNELVQMYVNCSDEMPGIPWKSPRVHGFSEDSVDLKFAKGETTRLNKYMRLFENSEEVPFPNAFAQEQIGRKNILKCLELVMRSENKEADFCAAVAGLVLKLLHWVNPYLLRFSPGLISGHEWFLCHSDLARPLFQILLENSRHIGRMSSDENSSGLLLTLLKKPLDCAKSLDDVIQILRCCLMAGTDVDSVGFDRVMDEFCVFSQPLSAVLLLSKCFSRNVLTVKKCVELKCKLESRRDSETGDGLGEGMAELMSVRSLRHCCKLSVLKAVGWEGQDVQMLPLPPALKSYLLSVHF